MSDTPSPISIAGYYQQAAAPMTEVLRELYKLVNGRELLARQRAIKEAFGRATSWLGSLAKLDQTSDIQACHAANRALLEIGIDLALLHADQTDGNAKKLLAFERSQFLKHANTYDAFIKRTKRTPSRAFADLLTVGEQQRAAVKKLRKEIWGGEDHPKRWTGRESNLLTDAIETDGAAACSCWRDLVSLEEVYAERYQPMNWLTHGSAATAMRGMDDLDAWNAVALRDCMVLSNVAPNVLLHELPDLGQAPTVTARLERLRLHLCKDAPDAAPQQIDY